MTTALVDRIARAVLYEGYLLYPYRPSSLKNRTRWNFGVIYPQPWSAHSGDACQAQAELLVTGENPRFDILVRFLQLTTRTGDRDGWQEAAEREVPLCDFHPAAGPRALAFDFPAAREITDGAERTGEAVSGLVEAAAQPLSSGLWKLTLRVSNTAPLAGITLQSALLRSLASAHIVVAARDGEFVSLADPGEAYAAPAAACVNAGLWPVLAGENGDRSTMLCSPIILYDYPQVAPESPGDLYDSTEIDEILSLRILTLTDAEKCELRETGEAGRRILERTESLTHGHWMRLHGAMRAGPFAKEPQ